MISTEEALEIVSSRSRDFGIQSVPLNEAIGRVLREDLYSDRDLPPYDRVAMDGIAIKFRDFSKGLRQYNIEGVAAAGAAQLSLQKEQNCIEVMTGCMLPKGTDTVIRYEDLHIEKGIAQICIEDIIEMQNIHFRGVDRKAGELVVKSGNLISP